MGKTSTPPEGSLLPFSIGRAMKTGALKNRLGNDPMPLTFEAEFICAKDAASFLGIPLRSLYFYMQQGILPSYKLGRHRLFRRQELLNSLQTTKKVSLNDILR